ncbi:MAG TPA: alkaline phosphatase family protein [Mycobacteriales bacterium]|nr:alkaline phosphatase family protein [Mycobacteriales bacterium]
MTSMSRRELIAAITAAGAAAALGIPERAAAGTPTGPAVGGAPSARAAKAAAKRAAQTAPRGSDLGAVEHVIYLMMENRSYDHYFGAYRKGRGFDDHPKHSLGAFAQDYPAGSDLSPRKKLLPFHLSAAVGEDCTSDLTHNWGPQHQCWNHGKMDSYVRTHTSKEWEGVPDGATTMGYYTRREIPLYWALADEFTLCDAYHASILGPTHPNRLMAQTGTIDPAGTRGGPITDTSPDPTVLWSCTWPTVQEVLEDAGISWKTYHPSFLGATGKYASLVQYPIWDPVLYDPTVNPVVMLATDAVLPYFKAFQNPLSMLHQKAFDPTFPADFMADVAKDELPSVSWLIPPLGFDDHPSANPERGQWFVKQIIDVLASNPKVWSKTVLFLMYDENDGWFDHVSPPTAPKGTPGEWLTAPKISSATLGIRGPLGLGVRVPCLTVSPFSRGGHIATEVFDHTSQLQFLETRFGIEVPNISAWRRKTVGNLTSTLFTNPHDAKLPKLPDIALSGFQLTGSCSEIGEETELAGSGPTLPTKQRMPTQRGVTISAGHFFKESETKTDRVPLRSGRKTATTKSAYNHLSHGGEPAERR